MWMFAMIGVALVMGLRTERNAVTGRRVLLAVATLAVTYVAVRQHLL